MKPCYICNQTKALSEYYKSRQSKDGHMDKCKTCCAIYQRIYRRTEQGIEVGRKYGRKYRQTKRGKAVKHQINKRFCLNHPEQIKAQYEVSHAVRKGALPHPQTLLCHYCPAQAEQYHHHRGYAKKHWLDVVSICVKCHRNIHRKIA